MLHRVFKTNNEQAPRVYMIGGAAVGLNLVSGQFIYRLASRPSLFQSRSRSMCRITSPSRLGIISWSPALCCPPSRSCLVLGSVSPCVSLRLCSPVCPFVAAAQSYILSRLYDIVDIIQISYKLSVLYGIL